MVDKDSVTTLNQYLSNTSNIRTVPGIPAAVPVMQINRDVVAVTADRPRLSTCHVRNEEGELTSAQIRSAKNLTKNTAQRELYMCIVSFIDKRQEPYGVRFL